jgi:lipoprotein-releasing system permease protein
MTRLELSIAWRYMRSRRGSRLLSLISVIAVGGVIVGVSALIVIMGVMNGLQTDLREKILVASPDIRIQPYGPDMVLKDSAWRAALATIKKQRGVVAVSPFVTTMALVSAGHSYIEGTNVMGIVPGDELAPDSAVTAIRTKATAGDFSFRTPNGGHAGAVLGEALASRLEVTPGVDSIQLMSANGMKIDPATGQLIVVTRHYLVTGTFKTGMYEYDNNYILLSLSSAQDLAQLESGVTGLEIKTPTRWDAEPVAARLQPLLGNGMHAVDWHSQNSALFQALALEKIGMTFILLLIVLVAAFNIVGTLTMVVADKTREIGILRAMGMPARSIRRVFLAQGMFIGLVGTIIGVVIGLAVSVAIDRYKLIPLQESVYFIDHLPVATQWLDVLRIVVASLVIAAIATIYPARLAAGLFPVEAIRHE